MQAEYYSETLTHLPEYRDHDRAATASDPELQQYINTGHGRVISVYRTFNPGVHKSRALGRHGDYILYDGA